MAKVDAGKGCGVHHNLDKLLDLYFHHCHHQVNVVLRILSIHHKSDHLYEDLGKEDKEDNIKELNSRIKKQHEIMHGKWKKKWNE